VKTYPHYIATFVRSREQVNIASLLSHGNVLCYPMIKVSFPPPLVVILPRNDTMYAIPNAKLLFISKSFDIGKIVRNQFSLSRQSFSPLTYQPILCIFLSTHHHWSYSGNGWQELSQHHVDHVVLSQIRALPTLLLIVS